MKTFATTTAFVALAAAHPALAATNLLDNGSFEAPAVTTAPYYSFYAVGSTAITGWTAAGNNVQLTKNIAFPGLNASDGEQYLDLTGNVGRGGGVVADAVSTVAGLTYSLTFDVGAFYYQGSYGAATVDLVIDGETKQSFTSLAPSSNSIAWTSYSYNFTGTGSPVSIGLFSSTSTSSSNLGVGLDNVVLQSVGGAVPEPTTWAMLIFGFGTIGFSMRARQRPSMRLLQG